MAAGRDYHDGPYVAEVLVIDSFFSQGLSRWVSSHRMTLPLPLRNDYLTDDGLSEFCSDPKQTKLIKFVYLSGVNALERCLRRLDHHKLCRFVQLLVWFVCQQTM